MPIFRPLDETAPDHNPNLRWPVSGLAYVIGFSGAFCGGPTIGLIAGNLIGLVIGTVVGIALGMGLGWCSDKYADPWIAKHENQLQEGRQHLLLNVAGFITAIFICALSIGVTLAVMYTMNVPLARA